MIYAFCRKRFIDQQEKATGKTVDLASVTSGDADAIHRGIQVTLHSTTIRLKEEVDGNRTGLADAWRPVNAIRNTYVNRYRKYIDGGAAMYAELINKQWSDPVAIDIRRAT